VLAAGSADANTAARGGSRPLVRQRMNIHTAMLGLASVGLTDELGDELFYVPFASVLGKLH
jgi:hypothetical protein